MKTLAQLMRRAGISVEELEGVKEVIIRTHDSEIVLENATVTVMDAQGSKIFQVTGTPEVRRKPEVRADEMEAEKKEETSISQEDIELVMAKAGCSEEDAKAMLRETGGDLAEAISRLCGDE